jgi:hypothetical protein
VSTIANEEPEEAQRNGFVLVIFGMGPRAQADRTSLWKIMYIVRSLPSRVASIHFCYDDPEAKNLANLAIMALDRKSRARFRTHYGKSEGCVRLLTLNLVNYTSHIFFVINSGVCVLRCLVLLACIVAGYHDDVVAELSTFGIGSNLLTVDPRSEESTMVIREWFATRRLKEASVKAAAAAASNEAAPVSGVVSEIGHYDVLFGKCSGKVWQCVYCSIFFQRVHFEINQRLCSNSLPDVPGRGKGIQAHPGNKRLRELVEANLERYEQASRLEKTLLAETIVRNIKDTSGRFLKLDSGRAGGWTEVNDEVARDKIAHAFRTQRKSLTQRQSPINTFKTTSENRKPPPSSGSSSIT